jgi:hypothetical protein
MDNSALDAKVDGYQPTAASWNLLSATQKAYFSKVQAAKVDIAAFSWRKRALPATTSLCDMGR